MERFNRNFKRIWKSKLYRGIFLLTLISGCLFLIIGLGGLQLNIYTNTGITLKKDVVVHSEYDDSPMYLNFYIPADDVKTDVGVILAHGFSSDRWGLQEFAITLAKTGLNVAVFDERGHGDSWGVQKDKIGWSGQNKEIRAEQAQGDLLAVYNYLKAKNCKYFIVIGHSMGGLNSVWFACKYFQLIDATIAIGAAGPDIDDFLSDTEPPNLLLLIGKNEELVSEENALNTLSEAVGIDNVKADKTYGNFSEDTARRLEVVSNGKKYIGHIQEITEPHVFIRALNWIKETGAAIGFDIEFDNSDEEEIEAFCEKVSVAENRTNFGILLLFVPFAAVVCSFAIRSKLRVQKNLETLIKQKSIKPFINFALTSVLATIAGVGFAFISYHLSLFKWTLIKYSNFIMGVFIGFGLVWYLFFYTRLHRNKNLSIGKKEPAKYNKKNFITNFSVGLTLGLYYGLANYLFLNTLGFSSTIGSIPLKPVAWLAWVGFSALFAVLLLPEEIYLRSYQESFNERGFLRGLVKLSIRNTLVKIPVILIAAMVFFIIPPDLMIIYIVASVLVLEITELVSVYLYQLTKSITVTTTFNGISIAWFLISTLPFVY